MHNLEIHCHLILTHDLEIHCHLILTHDLEIHCHLILTPLLQVEVMEMNPSWSGTLSIGVTALLPAQVISAIKAQQLPGQSFVIAANGEKSTVLYIGGQVGCVVCDM